jgi:DNA-binding beta-propeller fold protein YncE
MKLSAWSMLAAIVALAGIAGGGTETGRAATEAPQTNRPGNAGIEKGGEGDTGPYEVVRGWPQKYQEPGLTWGMSTAVVADTPNRVLRVQTGDLPVLNAKEVESEPAEEGGECCVGDDGVPIRMASRPQMGGRNFGPSKVRLKGAVVVFDAMGKPVARWEHWDKAPLGDRNHRIAIDPYDRARSVWITGPQGLYKFSNDGAKLLMTIGADTPGKDKTHLGHIQDLAFAPNGDVYVVDSPANARIVKFSKDGTYLMEWGKPGKGPGELSYAHALAIDARQRLYVADRDNHRIQVFDANGNYLDEWPNLWRVSYIGVSEDQYVWVTDEQTNKILKFDTSGRLLYSWGTLGGRAGQFYGLHHLATDSDGNLYTSDIYSGRTQKFRPKRGADPSHLIKGVLRGRFQ